MPSEPGSTMMSIVFKNVGWMSFITCLISTTVAYQQAAVSCELDNETYICTGAQYRMHCDTQIHRFYYQRGRDQKQYQCISNDCVCLGDKDTCSCYFNTSSCFCETVGSNISVPTTVRPVYECVQYSDVYICTGARYQMYCNTSVHDFHYNSKHHHCYSDGNCIGYKDTCSCGSSSSSSCFCTDYSNITIPAAVTPVYDCGLFNNMYICTGAQYRMFCNTRIHNFNYARYKSSKQYWYYCWGNNCGCFGNKDSCTCYSSTLASCFCDNFNMSITIPTAASPIIKPDCVLYNDMYICTGAQYRMYCNTTVHDFSYQRYQYQNQYQCVSYGCDCFSNNDTCSCSSSTLSSCFCETYGNSIAVAREVSPAYGCLLYNDTYICTGAQYHMYCNTTMHDLNYQIYNFQNQYVNLCWNYNSYCIGDGDTCTCYSPTVSSCFCETYGNIIALSREFSPAYGCVLHNDMYICGGAQYRMYCNTTMHDFFYWRHQDQDQYVCMNDNCFCFSSKYSCTCYSSTFSSCFCEHYDNNITVPTVVSPLTVPQCVLHNDMYICTGAQYRMYCNTTMHYFYYQIYQYQSQYEFQCWNNDCDCSGNNDTCTCYSETDFCFCEFNISISTTVSPTTAALNITLLDQCESQASGRCLEDLFEQIENITELPVNTVKDILTLTFNTLEMIFQSSSSSSFELASVGNLVLKSSEKLISTLVKPTDTNGNVSFTLPSVEGQVFMVGPQVTLEKIPRLDTTQSSLDIDLIDIANNNNERSAAVAFMSYNTMENLLKPDFFNTLDDTIKTMMSTVISATLPKTTNTRLTKPVNFTLRHIREWDPSGSLSCVYWNISEWIVDGCSVVETSSSSTVCSCVHLSTFTVIMQTSRPPESDSPLDLLDLVCVSVGLLFFSLALLTFTLCRWSPGVNNVARINICISLLLAHLLFLLTQQFLSFIRPQQVLCAVISGLLHFLFLSGFVWMFIEAVLLFICVRNLSQISSRTREGLSSRFLCVIGYVVPLVVSVALGHSSEHCWIKIGFFWRFLGPVCVILTSTMIVFIIILITLKSNLSEVNAEVSQMKQTKIMVFKTLAQFVVFGCPWILVLFSSNSEMLEILFLIFNSQQGTFIFFIYCVFNDKVRQQYMKHFRILCLRQTELKNEAQCSEVEMHDSSEL